MINLFKQSLDLVEKHLDSISDGEFLRDYLSVEKNQGPLAHDYLSNSNYGYEIDFEIIKESANRNVKFINFDINLYNIDTKMCVSELLIVATNKTDNAVYDSLRVVNDCIYSLAA